jgi:predicted NUDIX family phosphoesterase
MEPNQTPPRGLSFLEIAEYLLREAGRPMTAREIVSVALRRGLLVTNGQTPWQTMKSKLATDILSHGERSRFKRSNQALFTLREFDNSEYHATRFQKNKLDEDIAVIDITCLGDVITREGYHAADIDRALLASLARPMLRRDAEEDFSVVQLVSVFVVHCQGLFLTHMRSARLPEQRLHGQYSMMLGGHLCIDDFAQLTLPLSSDFSLDDCSYILRELSEELVLEAEPGVVARGYLYDSSRDVSKQHLGLVYLVDIPEPNYRIGERGFLMNSRFEKLSEIGARLADFENWSLILFENIEEIAPSAQCRASNA